MRTSKNDLSFGKVKLDYTTLITTAKIAFHGVLQEINKKCEQLRDTGDEEDTAMYLNAHRLEEAAKSLVICAETLHALQGGVIRERIEIVNKPQLPDGKLLQCYSPELD